jgi:hypothetical protein
MINSRNREPRLRPAYRRSFAAARAQLLCALLLTLGSGAAVAAPPAGTEWVPSFASEFTGVVLPLENWSALDRPAGAMESARAVENVEAGDGRLRLVSRLVEKDGWHWTTARLSARGLRQTYGYFEAKIRIAAATGLGSRFALVGIAPPDDESAGGEVTISLDGHYPDTLVMSLRGTPHPVMQRIRTLGTDLSDDFHRYGIAVLQNERGSTTIGWYLDDRLIGNADCATCGTPMRPEFDSSVSSNAKVAGPATIALDGLSMDVVELRAYQAKDLAGRRPALPPEADGSEHDTARRDAALARDGGCALP